MANIPKKAVDRITGNVGKFQRILKMSKDKDVNEANTVSIVKDILSEVFGFDKNFEVTSEERIRGTYCDLVIKIDDKIQYLLEVKAIGLTLKEHHLQQLVTYGAKGGDQWVILTNGIEWEMYRIRFEKPINQDLVLKFDFLDLNPRKTSDQEKLFLLCKEGLKKTVREDFWEHIKSVNRFVIGAIILSDEVVSVIKREVRKLSSGLKIEDTEIQRILQNEVLKRDVIEGEQAEKAMSRIKRILGKPAKKIVTEKFLKEKPRENVISSTDEPFKESGVKS